MFIWLLWHIYWSVYLLWSKTFQGTFYTPQSVLMPGIVSLVISSRLLKTWNPGEKRPRSYTGIINCILNSSPSVHRSVELSSLIKETWFHSRWRLLLEAATGHSAGIDFTWDVRPQLVHDTAPPSQRLERISGEERGRLWKTKGWRHLLLYSLFLKRRGTQSEGIERRVCIWDALGSK